jgi:NAD(P)-dependent dehydrogenase (short-subunit alcohol dehydrogenase family)
MARSEFPEGVTLVVGGSGGIGGAAAGLLAARGSDVAITYRGGEARANAVVEAITAAGRRGSAHRLDLADPDACAALAGELARRHGRVHAVVHAAGSRISQPYVSTMDLDEWKRVLDADVNGFVHVVKAFLPHFRGHGGGSFTVVSSAGLVRFPPGDVLSVAPKGAIEALVHAIAREEGRHAIRANTVAVGVVDAGMFPELVARGELDQTWLDAARKNVALRRFAGAGEVAEAIAFLASERASYITGQRLVVDGGYSL